MQEIYDYGRPQLMHCKLVIRFMFRLQSKPAAKPKRPRPIPSGVCLAGNPSDSLGLKALYHAYPMA